MGRIVRVWKGSIVGQVRNPACPHDKAIVVTPADNCDGLPS